MYTVIDLLVIIRRGQFTAEIEFREQRLEQLEKVEPYQMWNKHLHKVNQTKNPDQDQLNLEFDLKYFKRVICYSSSKYYHQKNI